MNAAEVVRFQRELDKVVDIAWEKSMDILRESSLYIIFHFCCVCYFVRG